MNPAFTVEEWKKILNSELDLIERGVVVLVPFAGLTTNAMAHLRDEWIEWRSEVVEIRVPKQASCNTYSSRPAHRRSNTLPPIQKREKPCSTCLEKGDTDGFENLWDTGYDVEIKRYRTILNREIAAPAVEFLKTVFFTHGRKELSFTVDPLCKAARSATEGFRSESAPITKLRRTGPVIYNEYGLTHNEISEIMPYTQKTVKLILDTTPEVNSERIDTQTLLKTINDQEPVTAAELGEVFDRDPTGVRRRLNHLKDKSRVTVKNSNFGPPAAQWSTTDNWDDEFECSQCSFSSWSVSGIQTHRDLAHD
jgi:hypothetical protein